MKKIHIIILLLLLLTPILAVASNYDEAKLTINSWLGKKPKVLVKLDIHLPRDAKGKCYTLVRRFPTMYNPTKDGYTEKVYAGVHNPGDIVEVKKILNAYISKIKINEKTGETEIAYYEPQEFFVAVLCKSGDEITFKWNKIIEVYPNSIIYKKDIYPEKEASILTNHISSKSNDRLLSSQQIECSIQQDEYIPGTKRTGKCYTWVRGPWIYSMWFVEVRFGIKSNTAVYIEAFSDFDPGLIPKPESEVQWSSAGKKLAYSSINKSTPALTGPYMDRIYLKVKYVYEWGNECDSFAGNCYSYWLLYPTVIRDIVRSGATESSQIPNETSYYNPPSSCEYPCGTIEPNNVVTIWFYDSDHPPYVSDTPLASIGISFSFYGVWSQSPITLLVSFYKAGRHDSQYTTPFVKITNNRGSIIYWWYKSDDPMTYTVRIGGAQTRPRSIG